LLSGEHGNVESVVVFSRDEAKQNAMRLEYERRRVATDEVAYGDYQRRLRFVIGDVADPTSVRMALQNADVVFHAAALKQVPSCEYFPAQAVRTNVLGAETIVSVIAEHELPVSAVVGISTDKACKPVNVMGMTKALQERIFIQANIENTRTRYVAARYGNVLASRGSVIPLFLEQAARGGPLTITVRHMTRFLMTLDTAVDTVLAALDDAERGEIYVPQIPSAQMIDVANAIVDERPIDIVETGVRPGEKIHEILVSEDEATRTVWRGDYLVIKPMLPELRGTSDERAFEGQEYSSADQVLDPAGVRDLLASNGFIGPAAT
jgi:UDP-glucose 4-epimerase